MEIISLKETKISKFKKFSCGNYFLDLYLYAYANQNEKKNFGRTYLLVNDDTIIGYYTIATSEIIPSKLDDDSIKGLPKYSIPCVKIARLGVDCNYQKRGFGKYLLKNAIEKIREISMHVGVSCILIEAKDEAIGFYKRCGFYQSPKDKNLLFLPVEKNSH